MWHVFIRLKDQLWTCDTDIEPDVRLDHESGMLLYLDSNEETIFQGIFNPSTDMCYVIKQGDK